MKYELKRGAFPLAMKREHEKTYAVWRRCRAAHRAGIIEESGRVVGAVTEAYYWRYGKHREAQSEVPGIIERIPRNKTSHHFTYDLARAVRVTFECG